MESKPERESHANKENNPINSMQIRMLKSDASPMKKRLAEACSNGMESLGFDVWLHIYDLGPMSKWMINSWNPKSSGLGAFHCGIEVLGVEWSFQAMIDCETDEMTGVMCHTPKSHPRHVYRESIWLGGSSLCANEICNVLARLERDWPARSYHFLSRNCTDFAEALSNALDVPTPFPSWAHGLAKGLTTKPSDGSVAPAPWWIPSGLVGCCNAVGSCGSQSQSCQAAMANGKGGKVRMPCSTGMMPGCDELILAPKPQNPYYPRA